MKRRDFLKLAAAGALGSALPGCDSKWLNLVGSGDEKLWGLNVHPYGGSLDDLQIRALEQLGVRKIRITLGLNRDLAGPYFRAYSAEYLGIISDFFRGGIDRGAWPGMVREAVSRSSGAAYLQVLNEPDIVHNMRPEVYVLDYLRPAYEIIREARPGVPIVSAAPGSTSGGRVYFFQMTEAGADDYCDYRGVHLYDDSPEVYLAGTDRPFIVTETGTRDRGRHVPWWTDDMARFSKVLDTDRLYWYVLLDRPDDGYSLIADSPDAQGNPRPVSGLYDHIRGL